MKPRGFSLVETVLATATLALAVTLLMTLVQQYVRVGQHSAATGVEMTLRDVLHGLVDETRTALRLEHPLQSSNDSLLRFTRIRPTVLPVPGNDPWPLSRQMTVTYFLQAGQLRRQVAWPGTVLPAEVVAGAVSGFNVRHDPDSRFQITLSWQHSGRVGTLQEVSRLWRD